MGFGKKWTSPPTGNWIVGPPPPTGFLPRSLKIGSEERASHSPPERKRSSCSLLFPLGSFPSRPSLPQRKKTPSAPGALVCGCCPHPSPRPNWGTAGQNREQYDHSSLAPSPHSFSLLLAQYMTKCTIRHWEAQRAHVRRRPQRVLV